MKDWYSSSKEAIEKEKLSGMLTEHDYNIKLRIIDGIFGEWLANSAENYYSSFKVIENLK